MPVIVKDVVRNSNGQWWVINTSPPSGNPTIYTVMEGTQLEALSYGGGIQGPFSSQSTADNVANGRPENSNAPGPLPFTSISPGGNISVHNPITSVEQFLSMLTNANLWLRIGEFILGVALIGVGLAKLTGVDNVITSTAKKIPVLPI